MAPLLFLGAMAGGAYGSLLEQVMHIGLPPASAIVGMGAVLTAATRAPLTAIFLVLELTEAHQMVLPTLLAVAAASVGARAFSRLGLYHQELRALGGPAYEVRGSALPSLLVEQAMRREVISLRRETPLPELLRLVLGSNQEVFPVVDEHGKFVGAVRLATIRGQLRRLPEEVPVVAADLAEDVRAVPAGESLEKAAELLAEEGSEELVVVDPTSSRPVGLLSARDLLRASVRGSL